MKQQLTLLDGGMGVLSDLAEEEVARWDVRLGLVWEVEGGLTFSVPWS